MKLYISTGNSRMEKRWNNVEMELDEFIERISHTIRTAETVEQYMKMTKAKQDAIKDVGGYVGGRLKGGRRKKDCVEFRIIITLDIDHAVPGVIEQIEMLYNYRCFIYSTHKHTPENPRLRLVIILSRPVSPDEYVAIARKVAEDIGIEMFDDTTYEPSRLMYWPSTSADGEFIFRDIEGEPLNPDEVLSRYKDWRDSSEWPVSSRQQSIVQREMRKQADPLTKDGVIGAFCRTYTIEDAIAAFLSDVYQPSTMPGRYDYIPADSQAGVVIYEGKFAYSHHATDPACGRLMNAFDMVRIHRFGDMDAKTSEDTEPAKLPSFTAMSEFAVNDENVKMTIAGERMEKAEKEFSGENEDWQKELEYEKRSTVVKNTLRNLLLILNNDEKLKGIVFNQLSDGMEIKGAVPWEHPGRFWRDADDAQLISYIDLTYGTFSMRNYNIAVTKAADDRSYHPVREFLDALPEWDKVPRVDTLLIDYLKQLEKEGRRTAMGKTMWHYATVGHILKNRLYCGELEYRKEYVPDYLEQKRAKNKGELERVIVEGKHQPIVTKEEFERVQKMMAEKDAQMGQRRKNKGVHSDDLWRRKMRCQCGHAFAKTKWHTKTDFITYTYKCYDQTRTGTIAARLKNGLGIENVCRSPLVQDWKMYTMAQKVLHAVFDDPEGTLLDAAAVLGCGIAGVEQSEVLRDKEIIEEQLKKERGRYETLLDMRMNNEIPKEVFSRKQQEVGERIAELEQRMAQYGDVEPATEADVSGKLENLQKLMGQSAMPEDGEFSEEEMDKYVSGVRVYEDRFEWLLNLSPDAGGGLDDAGSPVYFKKITVTPDDERAWFRKHPQWSKSNRYAELEVWIFI